MAESMEFPNTVEEFMEQYKVVDTECVYTNGVELVPIFRMKQWFEHLPSAEPDSCEGCEWEDAFGYGECHHCKRNFDDMYEVKEG